MAYPGLIGKCYGYESTKRRASAEALRRAFADGKEGDATIMASKNSNQINVPEAREAMDKFKMEAAREVGVNLKQGYNGDLSSREAGSVGGQMVKKMIEAYERSMH